MLILVVDDDPLAAEMTAAIVEDAGYQFLIAENGLEALEAWENNKAINVIVSDMNMPLMDGIELFHELRSLDCDIPFILLSGDDPESALQREPALNASLLKDFALQESLIETIKQVMM